MSRARPERVVLPPRPGVAPSTKPPVRIFLGTEASQHRAERVFFWSIEKQRDPARSYEIHRMDDLEGFDDRAWTTGFTGYRFAIPAFAGGSGRAIYNDVDEIYLADPAELFDADLAGHGFLALSDDETSVMLLDCARMQTVWPLDKVRRSRKKALLAAAAGVPGLRGALPPEWNARDGEHRAGTSKLLHYTTLHTQPWRPFPRHFVYQEHANAEPWHALEREADAAGYHPFSRERPSTRFAGARPAPDGRVPAPRESAAERVTAAAGSEPARPFSPWDLPREPAAASGWIAGAEACPSEDLPWALDALLASARRFALLVAEGPPGGARRLGRRPLRGAGEILDAWRERLACAGRSHPGVSWAVALLRRGRVHVASGGPLLAASPRVWVLTDDRPGNDTQSLGLARALGLPFERRRLVFRRRLADLPLPLLGACRRILAPGSDALEAPWPDLLIAAGRRSAPVARWIRARSLGRTRVVLLGRKATQIEDGFDLGVTPRHARLFPHPRRIGTTGPLHRVREDVLAAASLRWKSLFDGAPSPRVALLVGGRAGRYELSPDTAQRLGEEALALVQRAGGSLFVTTSRRTGPAATSALAAALAGAPCVRRLHTWVEGAEDDPYLGFLGHADVLIVTGESESMLVEACSTGKPVLVQPLPARPPSPRRRWREAVLTRARIGVANRRGTLAPQRGLARLAGRLVERGWVLPPRDLESFHAALFEAGVARPFAEAAAVLARVAEQTPAAADERRLDETARAAEIVRRELGLETPRRRGGGVEAG